MYKHLNFQAGSANLLYIVFFVCLLSCCTYSFSLNSPIALKHYFKYYIQVLYLRALHKTFVTTWYQSWILISSILCDPEEKPPLKGRETKGGDYLWQHSIFWATRKCGVFKSL